MTERTDTLRPTMLSVAAGDRDAFSRLYDEAAPDVFGVISGVLPARLAQETFVELWTSVWADPEPLIRAKLDTRSALKSMAIQLAAHALHHRAEPI